MASKIKRVGFRADGSPAGFEDYAVLALAFIVVLAFCVKGTMRDAESNKRLFQWE